MAFLFIRLPFEALGLLLENSSAPIEFSPHNDSQNDKDKDVVVGSILTGVSVGWLAVYFLFFFFLFPIFYVCSTRENICICVCKVDGKSLQKGIQSVCALFGLVCLAFFNTTTTTIANPPLTKRILNLLICELLCSHYNSLRSVFCALFGIGNCNWIRVSFAPSSRIPPFWLHGRLRFLLPFSFFFFCLAFVCSLRVN